MASFVTSPTPGAGEKTCHLSHGRFDEVVPQIGDQFGMFELTGVLEGLIEATESGPEFGLQLLLVGLAACSGL